MESNNPPLSPQEAAHMIGLHIQELSVEEFAAAVVEFYHALLDKKVEPDFAEQLT